MLIYTYLILYNSVGKHLMKETLEYKILKYLSDNDNGEYIEVSKLSSDKKLLKSKLIELRQSKRIKTNFGEYHIAGVKTKINFLAKITIIGNEYLSTLSKSNITNNFNNSSVGNLIQESDLSKARIKSIPKTENNTPLKKSLIQKLLSNPWVIGLVFAIIAAIFNSDRIMSFINDRVNEL